MFSLTKNTVSKIHNSIAKRHIASFLRQARCFSLPVAADTPWSLRHIGPNENDVQEMLKAIGVSSRAELVEKTVPRNIFTVDKLSLKPPATEVEALNELRSIMDKNQIFKNFIGKGYYGTHTPLVILRNIIENPAWYTPYTPYQAEISQGRLEMLLNYQTMCSDLTGLPVSSASLLDEATACSEALMMLWGKAKQNTVLIDPNTFQQTLDVVRTRGNGFGWNIELCEPTKMAERSAQGDVFAILLQYPGSNGHVEDFKSIVADVKTHKVKVAVASDLLSLTLLTPPGEWGADAVFGSSQRFGVPMGYGGPHAAFLSTTEANKRKMPGRIIGVSKDSRGKPALRMAMQAREQHIRREKASSNICTAQALLANTAAAYGVYHGPEGLTKIASFVHDTASRFATAITTGSLGQVEFASFFDTVSIVFESPEQRDAVVSALYDQEINVFVPNKTSSIHVAFDETTTEADLQLLISTIAKSVNKSTPTITAPGSSTPSYNADLQRTSAFMTHPVFSAHRSETAMLRYLYSLQIKDLSLATAMIPLGSCTMKLNATAEMVPITWPKVNSIHPFAPSSQVEGYKELLHSISSMLCTITGFDACSLQPNSGAQGEYSGLQAIKGYLQSIGQGHRNLCLIPASAHGTNPASASMAGLDIVVVACDTHGNIDIEDLRQKAIKHADKLACIQLTYPSTHGVFEEGVREICNIIHQYGGQVYLDGANMNAQVGLTSPGDIGADVCHLNLHKTFCIPHGGGGPGVGPICVRSHLADFLPGHVYRIFEDKPEFTAVTPNKPTPNYLEIKPVVKGIPPVRRHPTVVDGKALTPCVREHGAVSAAPYGSASILPISWMYIRMMGDKLFESTRMAILNANYMMSRLKDHYPVLFTGTSGYCAHEFIIDIRPIKEATGISEEDIAKRLMDFSFHAPTMSFPVAGTLMIEPTESEPKYELDRFIDALITIREEIRQVENGTWDKDNNVLKNAPHTADMCLSDSWTFPYPRELAAYPKEYLRTNKYWPTVGRLDNVYGDRNVICTCPPIESYQN